MERQAPEASLLTWINGFCGCALTLITLTGQCIVFYVVKNDRRLRTPSNFYITSLAIADLLISIVSMPVWTMYTTVGYWPLPQIWCDIWNVSDFVLCTVSIYTILYISLDRYLCLRNPLGYSMQKTKSKTIKQLVLIWIATTMMCSAYIGSTQYYLSRGKGVRIDTECQVFFLRNLYLTIAMCFAIHWTGVGGTAILYWLIYQVVREVTSKSVSTRVVGQYGMRSEEMSSDVRMNSFYRKEHPIVINQEDGLHAQLPDKEGDLNQGDLNQSKLSIASCATIEMELSRMSTPNVRFDQNLDESDDATYATSTHRHAPDTLTDVEAAERDEKLRSVRKSFKFYLNGGKPIRGSLKTPHQTLVEETDHKAMKTIALLLVTFSICWLPLSVIFVVEAAWPNTLNGWWTIAGYWMGYVNSMLNPFCYAIGNPNFRETFKKVVLKMKHSKK